MNSRSTIDKKKVHENSNKNNTQIYTRQWLKSHLTHLDVLAFCIVLIKHNVPNKTNIRMQPNELFDHPACIYGVDLIYLLLISTFHGFFSFF